MNKNFLESIDLIAQEKGLDREQIIDGITEAISIAVKKTFNVEELDLKINLETFAIEATGMKLAMETVSDDTLEMTMDEARSFKPDAIEGNEIFYKIDVQLDEFERAILQSSKQVLRQKIKEAEYDRMIKEYGNMENEIVSGVIEDIKDDNIYMILNKTLAVLPKNEQIPGEKFDPEENVKVMIKYISSQSKRGPKITLSRRDPLLVKALFEELIPEVADGTIEVKSIAREPGDTCKVAVISHDDNLDALGTCIGENGERVNNISQQISGEKIELIE